MLRKFFTKSWLRVLSGLFTNLAAAWVILIVATPNFLPLISWESWWRLTYESAFAIFCLIAAVKFDEATKR